MNIDSLLCYLPFLSGDQPPSSRGFTWPHRAQVDDFRRETKSRGFTMSSAMLQLPFQNEGTG